MTRRLMSLMGLARSGRASATGPGAGRPLQLMTHDARAVFRGGFGHAVRLGHRHLGCEHLLLALVEGDHRVAAVLRARGLLPGRVEEQVVRLAGDDIFGGLDEDSLTAIGIDLDTVRARALASFGSEALSRASQAIGAGQAGRRAAGTVRWFPGIARTQPGVFGGGVFLPHSPDVAEFLRAARIAERPELGAPLDMAELAADLLSVTGGAVPQVLAALGASAPALREAIAEIGEPGGA
jgi:hypothetical protein